MSLDVSTALLKHVRLKMLPDCLSSSFRLSRNPQTELSNRRHNFTRYTSGHIHGPMTPAWFCLMALRRASFLFSDKLSSYFKATSRGGSKCKALRTVLNYFIVFFCCTEYNTMHLYSSLFQIYCVVLCQGDGMHLWMFADLQLQVFLKVSFTQELNCLTRPEWILSCGLRNRGYKMHLVSQSSFSASHFLAPKSVSL